MLYGAPDFTGTTTSIATAIAAYGAASFPPMDASAGPDASGGTDATLLDGAGDATTTSDATSATDATNPPKDASEDAPSAIALYGGSFGRDGSIL